VGMAVQGAHAALGARRYPPAALEYDRELGAAARHLPAGDAHGEARGGGERPSYDALRQMVEPALGWDCLEPSAIQQAALCSQGSLLPPAVKVHAV